MSKDQAAAPAVSKKGMRLHYRRLATPYLMLAPMLAFVLIFMIWPIINVFIMSLEEYKISKPNDRHFIGLENFIQIFTNDDLFWRTLGNTVVYAVISVVFQCVLGFWLAYLLTRKFKGRGIVRALALVPWAVAGLMVGIIWNLMLGQTYGVLTTCCSGWASLTATSPGSLARPWPCWPPVSPTSGAAYRSSPSVICPLWSVSRTTCMNRPASTVPALLP